MPQRRSPMAKSRRRSLRGRGTVAQWFQRAAKDVGGFLRRNKILSRGGDFIKSLGILPPAWNAGLGVATGLAKKAGYGRMSGNGTHLAGGSMASTIRRAHHVVKSKRLMSRGLHMAMKSGLVPSKYAGAVSHAHGLSKSLGYGRMSGGALRLAGARKYLMLRTSRAVDHPRVV